MAIPMTASQFVAALIAEGADVSEYQSWRTHNRNHKGAWGPVNGVMIHHTVSSGEMSSVRLCYDGYSELPGPLCQSVIGKSGTTYMTGNGRCNHAGAGSPDVFAAVKDEYYGIRPPATRHHEGSAGAVDGNAHFYGAECVNLGDGKDPWPGDQIDAIVRWATAICRFHGWTEKSVIGHKEWSDWKSDPKGPGAMADAMPMLRAKIKERLAHAPSWNPGPASVPPMTGTPMTKPNRSLLRRTEDLALIPGVAQTIYWTTEYPDDANGHGDGGKTVGTNIVYDGVLNLRLAGLGLGDFVEVYAAEEDGNGVLMGESEIRHAIRGWETGHPVPPESAPVHGHVANRLVFRVVSRASTVVTVEEAWLSLHSWPQS